VTFLTRSLAEESIAILGKGLASMVRAGRRAVKIGV
jgi:hypothetical protein